jgi:hypothetical protein
MLRDPAVITETETTTETNNVTALQRIAAFSRSPAVLARTGNQRASSTAETRQEAF